MARRVQQRVVALRRRVSVSLDAPLPFAPPPLAAVAPHAVREGAATARAPAPVR